MEDKLIAVIAEALEIDKGSLNLNTEKNEIEEWDSLAHLIIITQIESEFHIKVPFENVNEIKRIEDFLKYIK